MKIGLICAKEYYGNEENKYTSSRGFGISSFYYALKNIFQNVVNVKSASDVEGLDCIFIGNYHFGPHKEIWTNHYFIETCNKHNTLCIFWSAEQILCPFYPWNSDLEKIIKRYNNCIQTVCDVNDAKTFNRKIGRITLSKEYSYLRKNYDKKNKIVFVGAVNMPEYELRIKALNDLSKYIKFDSYVNDNSIKTAIDYFDIISQYRYVFSPSSMTINGFSARFYDSLLVKSIPLQQVYNDTLDYFTEESKYKDAIYFENVEELITKLENYELMESYNCPWLEDVIEEFFRTEIGYKF